MKNPLCALFLVTVPELEEIQSRELTAREAGVVPSRGQFTFTGGDRITAGAVASGQRSVRCLHRCS